MCPECGHGGGWRLGDGRFWCVSCGHRTSVTAGTIFDRPRTPLTVWSTACWLFATQKDGVSASSLQCALEIGSYQTAWAMLHRLRSVLIRPGRDRLAGTVEIDETFMGGEELGLRGGRARGKKILVAVAVEVKEPKGYGRCRMAPIADASAGSLRAFLTDNIEPGATVVTDGWMGYHGIDTLGYVRDKRSQRAARLRGDDPHALLPGVHPVASLAKRWLLGTHQGSVDPAHYPPTSTSSCSASTVAPPETGVWSSTGSCSSPSLTNPSATATWSSNPPQRTTRRQPPPDEATHPASNAHPPTDPGAHPDQRRSGYMDIPKGRYCAPLWRSTGRLAE